MKKSSVGNACYEYCVIFPLISILSYVNYFPATVPTTAENKDDSYIDALSALAFSFSIYQSISCCVEQRLMGYTRRFSV